MTLLQLLHDNEFPAMNFVTVAKALLQWICYTGFAVMISLQLHCCNGFAAKTSLLEFPCSGFVWNDLVAMVSRCNAFVASASEQWLCLQWLRWNVFDAMMSFLLELRCNEYILMILYKRFRSSGLGAMNILWEPLQNLCCHGFFEVNSL